MVIYAVFVISLILLWQLLGLTLSFTTCGSTWRDLRRDLPNYLFAHTISNWYCYKSCIYPTICSNRFEEHFKMHFSHNIIIRYVEL